MNKSSLNSSVSVLEHQQGSLIKDHFGNFFLVNLGQFPTILLPFI